MNKLFKLEKFNFHIYLISNSKSDKGPVKIGYSHHPPSRLKEIQTGNPEKLAIWGSISVKDRLVAKAIEKVIHSHLKANNVQAQGEWFNINVKCGLEILELFPSCRDNLFKGVKVSEGKVENVTDLVIDGLHNNIITDDDYDILSQIFETADEEKYQFNNFTMTT